MKTVGIICEYNPFHNGHRLHMEEARRATGAEYVICAMSGSWMQRGEPAIADKWTRTRAALGHGADVVLELPTAWAVRAAGDFAAGGVALLYGLGVCTHLSFGSELPLAALERELGMEEDADAVRQALSSGQSYPRAVSGNRPVFPPNAVLGVEYLRALRALNSDMVPIAIQRNVPHDTGTLAEVTSASRIRRGIAAGEDVSFALPDGALQEALTAQGGSANWERLAPLVLHRLRNALPEELRQAYGVSEGMEHRILRAAESAASVMELFDTIKCKRYTHARIRRAIAHILLGISEETRTQTPSYARVLGFNKASAPLLREIERRADFPLITKVPREIGDPLLVTDVFAQELWTLSCPIPMKKGMDYVHPIVIV